MTRGKERKLSSVRDASFYQAVKHEGFVQTERKNFQDKRASQPVYSKRMELKVRKGKGGKGKPFELRKDEFDTSPY